MNPWINYHHLYYFKTIAEEGTVSKAAEKLRIGQPTLSAQLKQFEESLGVQLFIRKHKKLVITEHGLVAFDYAKEIFKMGSEMYDVIHQKLKPLRSSIHIGALDSIPKQITLKLVELAHKISPCQVTLSEGKNSELIRDLSAHQIDLVLSNRIPSGIDAKGLSHKLITKNNVAIYAAPKFKKLQKSFPQSVSGQPMIYPTYDSKMRQDLDHWAKLNKLEMNIIVESQDISIKKLLATHGMGLIACAAHTVKAQVKTKELVKIGYLRGVVEELFLLAAHRKVQNQIATKIIDKFNI